MTMLFFSVSSSAISSGFQFFLSCILQRLPAIFCSTSFRFFFQFFLSCIFGLPESLVSTSLPFNSF